jgi:hypothetical protein
MSNRILSLGIDQWSNRPQDTRALTKGFPLGLTCRTQSQLDCQVIVSIGEMDAVENICRLWHRVGVLVKAEKYSRKKIPSKEEEMLI